MMEQSRAVSWVTFAPCQHKRRNSAHKNGSILSEDKQATAMSLQMARRKPCVVLSDVLKTDMGRTHLERMKQRERSHRTCQARDGSKERRRQRETDLSKKCDRTPSARCQTPASTPRSGLRRRLQIVDNKEGREENKHAEDEVNGQRHGNGKFAEVVDCGLSVSWEPSKETAVRVEFSPKSIKETWTEPDLQQSAKRKRDSSKSSQQCNGTPSPKRQRESVLRLSGEERRGEPREEAPREEAPAATEFYVREEEELENDNHNIIQFSVGGAEDGTAVLVQIISPNRASADMAATSPADPIVLSSDDEESAAAAAVRPVLILPGLSLLNAKDSVIQRPLSEDAPLRPEEPGVQDMQLARVSPDELPVPDTPPPILKVDHSCMHIAFFTLHCGAHTGNARGDIMLVDQRIIFPLTDTKGRMELVLKLERKDLRRYSVWEEQEMEMREFQFNVRKDVSPAAVLVLCVSESAAAEVRRNLCKLSGGTAEVGAASPFILLTLRNPLEGMEGALLRSLLDIDCLNSLTNEQSLASPGSDKFCNWDDLDSPVMSLDATIDLIRKTGLDSQLLRLLDGEARREPEPPDSEEAPEEEVRRADTKEEEAQQEPQEAEPEEETGATLEEETKTVVPSEEKRTEAEQPSEEEKKEEAAAPAPVYTLCHARTQGSYSVSFCKPDSSWVKYKHQGSSHRLIQFPPPPLKGGITVTMGDLQCLDSRQYLNDVIIDFYLKYLFHHAPAALAERCQVFSSFFFKQLTRRDNGSEGAASEACEMRQRRHQRVKTWTRHVDIFKKDFLFVPVNQEAHWYLVVVCFPGLEQPEWVSCSGLDPRQLAGQAQTADQVTTPEKTKEEGARDPAPGPVDCTEKTFQKSLVCKRPCILIMDSLKLSSSRSHERVFKLLREYLQSEWEARRGSSREFGPDIMKGSHCQVPLQDNSSDCGLYLLQYVESFLKDPVVHFDLPLRLHRWFPRQQVRRKRDEIRDLVLNLYRRQSLDSNR